MNDQEFVEETAAILAVRAGRCEDRLAAAEKWTNRLAAVHGAWVRGEADDAQLDSAVRDLLMHTRGDGLT